MIDLYLTLQELKVRGWSLTMVRTLLCTHDHERFTNRKGRPVGRPIRLYLKDRVVALEATDKFAQIQQWVRAHSRVSASAKDTNQVGLQEAVTCYETLALPEIRLYSLAVQLRPSADQTVWYLHLQVFYGWRAQHRRVLVGVPKVVRQAAEQRMLQRYREAVDQAYGWPESTS